MTEKRETQLRLDESREQLFRSQKMEALGQLTGGLAHDFNNLLTAILGAADLASRNLDDKQRLKRMIEGIRNSAQRGANLTKQLLAFARAQPLEIKQIDLRQFLGDITTLVRPSLRSDIEVVTEMSDQLWNVDADAGALELVLLNLAFNSRDAMPERRSPEIQRKQPGSFGRARRPSRRACRTQVSDTGSGMDEDDGARVRALLHDQVLWPRHRPRTQPGVRFRQADRRRGHRRIRGRQGIDFHALFAGQPGSGAT